MSLYYQNFDDVEYAKHAKAIMRAAYYGLTPYFSFIDAIYRNARQRIYKLDCEILPSCHEIDHLFMEIEEIDEGSSEWNEARKRLGKHTFRRYQKVRKLFDREKIDLLRIISDDEDDIDDVKERFFSAESIYLNRNLQDPRKVIIAETMQEFDIIVVWRKEFREYLKNRANNPLITIYQRSSLYQIQQIKDAIEKLQNTPAKYNRNLIRLFEDTKLAKFGGIDTVNIDESNWRFLVHTESLGTTAQREFVKIALGTPDYALLEGPPGCGKTTTICELIYQALVHNQRVLLVASTHVAVDNVLENLMDESSPHYNDIKKIVLPIRIGRTDRISEVGARFHLDTYWSEERAKLKSRLSKIKRKTLSQELMIELLQSTTNSSSDYMKRIFINSSNLVCGTTIGILQHPKIKDARYSKTQILPYDLLILDEASKTPFHEFLVPALLAKRFIIVGDINQLPPFVDEEGVTSNLSNIEPKNGKWLTLINNLMNSEQPRSNPLGKCIVKIPQILSDNDINLIKEAIPSHIPYSILDGETDKLSIMGSSLVIGTDEQLQNIEKLLPSSISWVNYEDSIINPIDNQLILLSNFTYRHNYFKHHFPANDNFIMDDNWSDAISWRLTRDYELRLIKSDKKRRYWKQVEKLFPPNMNEKETKNLIQQLDQIRQLAFPSILELLQVGFGRNAFQERINKGTSITDGFSSSVLNNRFVQLKYQYRMHPDISAFPREQFYDDETLKDPEDMAEKRNLRCNLYRKPVMWIDTSYLRNNQEFKGKNFTEARIIISEIKKLIDWSKSNWGDKDKPLEVAIIPFYKAQENHIRGKLQKIFSTKRKREFYSPKHNIKVDISVVDRFQGHQADIIFLSFVRTKSVGFLDSPNRINVAITRPKYHLILVGNKKFLKNQRRSDLLTKLVTYPRFGDIKRYQE